MFFVKKTRRLPVVQLVILLTMLGGLLMGACGRADIAIDLDFSNGSENGAATVSQTTLFALLVVIFLTMVALVLAAGRSG
jgi:hypothetical protein